MQLFIHSHLALSMENQKLPEKKNKDFAAAMSQRMIFFLSHVLLYSCDIFIIVSTNSSKGHRRKQEQKDESETCLCLQFAMLLILCDFTMRK